MKTKLLLILALFVFLTSSAKDIDVTTALNVAKNFYGHKAAVNNSVNKQNLNLTLAYQCISKTGNSIAGGAEENLYYVFNVNTTDGFVIVSGIDDVIPVLGYSNKGSYNVNNLPPPFVKWMANYKDQILFAKTNMLSPTDEIKAGWDELISGKINNQARIASTTSVNPLCNTTWDQGTNGGGYNALCPYDNSCTCNCPTGCVATAMAQIMKYWDYPAKGRGFNSYTPTTNSSYGVLSVDFASATYNWTNMPLTTGNSNVALLMYDCGVAVNMDYTSSESGAQVISNGNTTAPCAQNAYSTYFGYDASKIQGLIRDNYSDNDWKTLLKNELDNSRPIQYAGFGNGGGHTFVFDGYDSNDFFDVNWGWGGIADGYYDIDALNPTQLGIGGGLGSYNSEQQALIGIQPPPVNAPGNIKMYSSITVTPNPINFYQSFTVNANVYNSDNTTFNGDLCAALFNPSGILIDYVQILTTGVDIAALPAGNYYAGGLTFSNAGLLTVPGDYTVGIYYRTSGGNWNLASTNGYINPVSVQISSPSNPLELNSSITATPATFVQGQPGSLNVDFLNDDYYTFYGTYEADLFTLDGYYVQTIGSYDETTGLSPGYDYPYPYISFSSGAITADPGTYILVIAEEAYGDTTWYYVGGDYYPNPVNISVVAPPPSPDIYERNNTQDSAYNLPLSWVSNAANPQTTGSNIHISSDIDYYKITLAGGYSYTITGRVDDSYDSNNGNTYTCDVLLSDSVSGYAWSDAYDPSIPGNIIVNGPGTVTFLVAPYFPGETGTYLLDLHITRTPATGMDELTGNNKLFELYPNPTSSVLIVKWLSNNACSQLRIINSMGQIVSEIKSAGLLTNQTIDVSNLSDGVYLLEATDNSNKYSSSFIVHK